MAGRDLSRAKRGRLSPEEKAEIERLVETMAEPTPGKVALRLNRHPSTIQFHMISRGLWTRPNRHEHPDGGSYARKAGNTVNYYTPAEDARALALRREGKRYRPIAEALTAEFGTNRNASGVRIRILMLAAVDDDPETRQEKAA